MDNIKEGFKHLHKGLQLIEEALLSMPFEEREPIERAFNNTSSFNCNIEDIRMIFRIWEEDFLKELAQEKQ